MSLTRGTTVRAVVAESLRAAAHSGDAQERPVAVLWPDPDRTWEPAIRSLQEAVPILVLGDRTDDPEQAQGPALWIRAVLAAPEAVPLPTHLAAHDPAATTANPWVLHLPGIHRHELTDLTQIPDRLAPLADIALRSTWWGPPSGQNPWTPHAFLTSPHGARLDLASDAATRTALADVLPRLLDEDVDALRHQGRLDAHRLHARVMPDAVRTLLSWISDPAGARERVTGTEWAAFAHTCQETYGIDPAKDTHLTAAARLGARDGEWDTVWQRFADAPQRFPGIPAALDQARPASTPADDSPHPESWPSWNREQEDLLRAALTALPDTPDEPTARARLTALAAEHAPRATTVWAELGQAPLAHAVRLLGRIAHATSTDVTAPDVPACVSWYADSGHTADRLALEARATVTDGQDRAAVLAALHAVHDPWVDRNARELQRIVAADGYPGQIGLDVEPGTCVVYVDALRLDLAHRLADLLAPRTVTVEHRLAAFPTVTPTGQPAVVPVTAGTRERWGAGPGFDAGDPLGRSLKGALLRKTMTDDGVQLLAWDGSDDHTGDPAGIAWTQSNDIDSAGHAPKGPHFDTVLDGLLGQVAARVDALLRAGWLRIVVVTDHGFLLPARPARKADLPLAVTDGGGTRKPRVARLREGAPPQPFPTVPWTWDPAVTMVSAPGAAAFEEGVTYDHGGLSFQECVIPVLTVADDPASTVEKLFAAQIHAIRWTGQRCRIDVVPPGAPVHGAVRISPGDATSTVGGPKAPNDDGEVKVLVSEEDAPEGTSAYVVLLEPDGTVVAQQQTTIGGDQ
ncbi:BREX-1 system phosphatase PglZ type B [Oerskovia turbata]|uniref:BREX-1 system phosphatase PglZ type B n=1 Tax=Oerskovia turbata TaxID=1713 RepID=A0A4Q1KZ07_9CELL|nr:BREX-1 system phosphatase PglZ type B [Oerskovia turbata]RXR27931.1 BREX-1 system phosphatase PglZ type B [Oerskovia turbata]RXR35631.1 BREX-1 system phosphatase PglZ type B [Oerskovia turbata]TGJ96609.1 BREX-1 system phosphatase PglZ type B [Actinotalea fermentans ATCC 43279 = JCM 9966 = DSM 3133]